MRGFEGLNVLHRRFGPTGALRASPEDNLTGTALLTTVRQSDPEYIKRLKREMQVAIRWAVPSCRGAAQSCHFACQTRMTGECA